MLSVPFPLLVAGDGGRDGAGALHAGTDGNGTPPDRPSVDADTAYKLHVRLAGQPNTLPIKLEAEEDVRVQRRGRQTAGALNASEPAARLLLREGCRCWTAPPRGWATSRAAAPSLASRLLPAPRRRVLGRRRPARWWTLWKAVRRGGEQGDRRPRADLMLSQPVLSRRGRSKADTDRQTGRGGSATWLGSATTPVISTSCSTPPLLIILVATPS